MESSDPLLTELARLSGLPASERREALEPFVAAWFEQRKDAAEIASRLALAGLEREDAEALVGEVRGRVAGRMAREARKYLAWGLAALAAGTLVAYFRAGSLWGLFSIGFLGMGLLLIGRGVRQLRRVTPPPEIPTGGL